MPTYDQKCLTNLPHIRQRSVVSGTVSRRWTFRSYRLVALDSNSKGLLQVFCGPNPFRFLMAWFGPSLPIHSANWFWTSAASSRPDSSTTEVSLKRIGLCKESGVKSLPKSGQIHRAAHRCLRVLLPPCSCPKDGHPPCHHLFVSRARM